MKRLLILFVYLFGVINLGAQIFDSTQIGFNTIANNTITPLDTSLGIEQYLSFTDNGGDDFGVISMGNQGDVRRSLIPIVNSIANPHLGINGYFRNYTGSQNVPFYNVLAPTGGIRILTGYEKGQLFGLFFTVNPTSRMNVFLDFQRINSSGPYFNQENRNDQLKFSSSFQTKERKYKVFSALSWNSATNSEFGGISDEDAFEDNTLSNRQLIPINLQASGTKVRNVDALIHQELYLLRLDSASNISLCHEIGLVDKYVAFASQDSLFAANALFDAQGIRDSIRLATLSNTIGIKWRVRNHVLRAGAELISFKYGNSYLLQTDNVVGLNGSYAADLGRLSYAASFKSYFNSTWSGSYDFNGQLNYTLRDDLLVGFAINNKNAAPSLFATSYISNNFIWNNSFSNIQLTEFNATVNYNRNWISVGYSTFSNYIYFDENARPAQLNEVANLSYAELNFNVPLLKNLYLDNRVRYQSIDQNRFIPIPNWILRNILYFQRDIFNKAARIQTGIEFNYFSSFASERYMPATTSMFLQEEANQQIIGNYPYFNLLFNFKIKEFTFFLRLENITQGLFEYNYYAAPQYPLPDFTLRVGATWRFFN